MVFLGFEPRPAGDVGADESTQLWRSHYGILFSYFTKLFWWISYQPLSTKYLTKSFYILNEMFSLSDFMIYVNQLINVFKKFSSRQFSNKKRRTRLTLAARIRFMKWLNDGKWQFFDDGFLIHSICRNRRSRYFGTLE